jgi:transposase InsO family protein
VADFTYIRTAEGWLYVAVALDLFSRRVVGWSMKADRDASLVMDALIPLGTLLRNALPGSGWPSGVGAKQTRCSTIRTRDRNTQVSSSSAFFSTAASPV